MAKVEFITQVDSPMPTDHEAMERAFAETQSTHSIAAEASAAYTVLEISKKMTAAGQKCNASSNAATQPTIKR